jgi:hypothetical protein
MNPDLLHFPSIAAAPSVAVPPICMSRHLCCKLMCTIGARPAESGGILLGPIGTNDVTDFYFDSAAHCTGATYTPDLLTLQRKMKEVWIPSGIDFKGFCHSHPGNCARLTGGDMVYIRRLLQLNPDMSVFAAPIVIPQAFRLEAIVVLADQPHIQHPTHFQIF